MSDGPRGHTPEEMERGEDRAWHISPWGCLAAVVVLTLACYGLYRWLISIGFSGQLEL